jgi:hypothetical protein
MRILLTLMIAVLAVCPASAQTAPTSSPAPELLAMEFFTGNWACEQKTPKANPFTSNCRWTTRKGLIACETTSPTGESVWSYSYNPVLKTLVLSVASGSGSSYTYTGGPMGGKWAFSRSGTYQEKPAKYEFSFTKAAADNLEYVWRRSVENGPWTQTSSGACNRVR